MKTTKRFLSIMIIAVMTICLGAFNVTVSAEGPYTITINNSNSAVSIANTEFKAYKLFNIEVVEDANINIYTTGNGCLENSNANAYTLDEKIWEPDDIQGNEQKFAEELYKNNKLTGEPTGKATAEANATSVTISDLSEGYYAVHADVDGHTPYVMLVSLVGSNATINLKLATPSIDKKIYHDDIHDWGMSADSEIGEVVKFKLESSLPNLNGYDSYTYIIEDTMSKGLTYVEIESVMCGDKNLMATETENAKYAFTKGEYNPTTGTKLKFDFTDYIKTIALNVYNGDQYNGMMGAYSKGDPALDPKITIVYKAKLNENANVVSNVPSSNNNPNTATLTYSNNPYNTDSKTITNAKPVYDYTFMFRVDKVDEKNKGLNGASFQIKKQGSDTPLNFINNGNNTYTLTDKTDNVVNTIETPNGDETVKGKFTLIGLDDDETYVICESKAPDNYKPAADVVFTISNLNSDSKPDYSDDGNTLSTLIASGKDNDTRVKSNSGILSAKIQNIKGSVLAGTGGIGTTIFYIAGGVLMAGAVVLLIVRKRTNK